MQAERKDIQTEKYYHNKVNVRYLLPSTIISTLTVLKLYLDPIQFNG